MRSMKKVKSRQKHQKAALGVGNLSIPRQDVGPLFSSFEHVYYMIEVNHTNNTPLAVRDTV
jgi:hypothetical protein